MFWISEQEWRGMAIAERNALLAEFADEQIAFEAQRDLEEQRGLAQRDFEQAA